MDTTLPQLLAALKGKRFDLQDEKVLQRQVAEALDAAHLVFQREVRLSPNNIIDFLVADRGWADIGIEVKLKGSPKAIYAQCLRYCQFAEVGQLLLLTNKAIHLPATIHNKPAHVLNLGLAWL